MPVIFFLLGFVVLISSGPAVRAEPIQRQRTTGRLHRVGAGRKPDRGHDLRGLSYPADHGRRQELPN
jgi:hypothetical protein